MLSLLRHPNSQDETNRVSFSVDFTDETLRKKIRLVLGMNVNAEMFAVWFREKLEAVAHGAGLGGMSANKFRYWCLHKLLWDVTRPTYGDVCQADLVKWALYPVIVLIASSQDEELKRDARALFSEFYLPAGLFSCADCYDAMVIATMRGLLEVYEFKRVLFRKDNPAQKGTWFVLPMCIVFFLRPGLGPYIMVMPRELFRSEKPLPAGASLVIINKVNTEVSYPSGSSYYIAEEPADIQFATGYSSTFISHGEGSGVADAGGGSAGASCS
jgi:hypothetical protein